MEVSQLRITWSDPLIESAIFLPLVSVDPEYQDRWCTLKSPRIWLSCVVRMCSIEDAYPLLHELAECRCWKSSTSCPQVHLIWQVIPGGDHIATLPTMAVWRKLLIYE